MAKKIICGVLLISLMIVLVSAEKLDIEIGNNYVPGENVKFKITLYDDKMNKINDKVNYIIQDYYTDIIEQGVIGSGEEKIFKLPENSVQGPWKVTASYKETVINRLFNVGRLEKANISLEGDILIIKNIGNTIYNKKILIYIGQYPQTAQIYLEIGQTKRVRLTAPEGNYDVRIIEGNEESVLEFKDVPLTGNVIGLESVIGDGFWKKYPLIGVFLIALILVALSIIVLKFINRKK